MGVNELVRQAGWLPLSGLLIHHFRTTTRSREEVDFVIEDNQGRIVAVEVKASAAVGRDFAGIRKFADVVKDRLVIGVVLYDGDKVIPFGSDQYAVPVSYLGM